jgi:hypothetical protein
MPKYVCSSFSLIYLCCNKNDNCFNPSTSKIVLFKNLQMMMKLELVPKTEMGKRERERESKTFCQSLNLSSTLNDELLSSKKNSYK